MLAAQIGVQHGADTNVLDLATSGPKRALVKQLGASYHTGRAPQAWSISLLVGCSAIAGQCRRAPSHPRVGDDASSVGSHAGGRLNHQITRGNPGATTDI